MQHSIAAGHQSLRNDGNFLQTGLICVEADGLAPFVLLGRTIVLICTAEDRPSFEPGIRLLLLSLGKHNPDLPIHVTFPGATDEFVEWVEERPKVTLVRKPITDSWGVNIKPDVLLSLLDQGHEEIVWIDSDIIVLQDISPLFENLNAETFVFTEEALGGQGYKDEGWRARQWGLQVGRILPCAVNSGVIRVTSAHRGLLNRWRELMASKEYRDVHRADWRNRPMHMNTDQDVLTAILSSSEFANVPIKIMRRGKDIIQYYHHLGYTVSERVSNMLGHSPKLVHSQGPKPWDHPWERVALSDLRRYFRETYLDLSPYTLAANRYKDQLNGDAHWLRSHFKLSRILRSIGFWYPPLVGLPLALWYDIAEPFKQIFRRGRARAAKNTQ